MKQLLPMKKYYTLKKPYLSPKKTTIDFLLNFSKSIVVISSKNQNFIVSKN